jgi:hypothetical protein
MIKWVKTDPKIKWVVTRPNRKWVEDDLYWG